MRFLSATQPELQELINYNNQVLNAFGVSFGPVHSEVILTPEGPVLVEIGARIHGGYTPFTVQNCASHSQLDMTAACYTDKKRFAELAQKPSEFIKQATVYFFVSDTAGTIKTIPGKTLLPKLKSHFSTVWNVKENGPLSISEDLYSCPGWVVLANENQQQFDEDLRKVQQYEQQAVLFELKNK